MVGRMPDQGAITAWPSASDESALHAMRRELLIQWRARGRSAPRRSSGGQRADGLRQQDVANLAGVSVRWYAIFERGVSHRRFSASFLMRVADALELDGAERAALSRLTLPEVAHAVDYFECVARQHATHARTASSEWKRSR